MVKTAETLAKAAAHRRIAAEMVPADILSRYAQRSMADAEAVWAFKCVFASQYGISALLCHAFAVADRHPHRIMFNGETARIMGHEFRPGYTPQGALDCYESVPFRLTRNITTLLSPYLVEGGMCTAMVAAAAALAKRSEALEPYLSLLLRDDIVSHYASRVHPKTEMEGRHLELQLADKSAKNVAKVLARYVTK